MVGVDSDKNDNSGKKIKFPYWSFDIMKGSPVWLEMELPVFLAKISTLALHEISENMTQWAPLLYFLSSYVL